MSKAISSLLAEVQAVVAGAVDAHPQGDLFEGLAERLVDLPGEREFPSLTKPVVDQWLEPSIAGASGPWVGLAGLLGQATPELPWLGSYESLESSAELEAFRALYSYQLLAGPLFRGHEPAVLVEDLLVGFSLQAPNVFYPQHHHEPPEIYGIISGRLKWQVGDTWSDVGPGDVIVHRSHESHAMQTFSEPALTWVAWPRNPHTSVYMPSLDPPDNTMEPWCY